MLDANIFSKYKTKQDFDNERAEFEARKRQQSMQEQLGGLQSQKLQYDIKSGAGLPATVRITNEIEEALKNGDIQRANLLSQVHKTVDRGISPYGIRTQGIAPEIGNSRIDGRGLRADSGNISPTTQEVQLPQNSGYQDIASQPDLTNGGLPQDLIDPSVYTAQPIAGYGDALGRIEGTKKRYQADAQNISDQYYDPRTKGLEEQAKLQQQLALRPQIADAISTSQSIAGKKTALTELEANLPQLERTVEQLSELGKDATYTLAGRGYDFLEREMGLKPNEGAIARTEYISTVASQILPLLKQTFGAAFTVGEGQELKATLGDPNKSPDEKDAILRAFIDQKKQQILTGRRELGIEESPDTLYQKGEKEFNKSQNIKVFNPATGRLE